MAKHTDIHTCEMDMFRDVYYDMYKLKNMCFIIVSFAFLCIFRKVHLHERAEEFSLSHSDFSIPDYFT